MEAVGRLADLSAGRTAGLLRLGKYVELSAFGVMLIVALFCFVMLAQFASRRFGIAEA